METRRCLKSLYLVGKLMELLVHFSVLPSHLSPWQFLFRPQRYWCHHWTGCS
ncbi:hypothetical protein DPMN_115299 [Dreissena polymorpha]|uniref:Uncharacterized protein n=1 Tax=Dreissena polymorpha TaxID=45954 RepID=A0A9D4KLS8_DREPO|nr:hypothetical protein DPMN_115299 [Dreissena polymorpha]